MSRHELSKGSITTKKQYIINLKSAYKNEGWEKVDVGKN